MKVVTFGELMLRLAPHGYERFVQAADLGATYGGGEANVAVSLANFGVDSVYVTKLPQHEIGQAALNSLRKFGVDTKYIARGGSRLGIYYLEKGASQRPSKVIYDRAGSAFSESVFEEYDWDKIFDGADWFHVTGITPALNDGIAQITERVLKIAKEKGVKTSCDLNYRKKLWTKEHANRVMTGLMKYVDLCISNEEDASDVFSIFAEHSDASKGKIDRNAYISVAKQLKDKFGFGQVAITLRTSVNANENKWAGLLYNGEAYFSKEYDMRIVDRVGGGDSFGAGLIYATLNHYGAQEAIDFAVAASALKHTVEGDYNMVGVEEVKALAGGNASGRVQR